MFNTMIKNQLFETQIVHLQEDVYYENCVFNNCSIVGYEFFKGCRVVKCTFNHCSFQDEVGNVFCTENKFFCCDFAEVNLGHNISLAQYTRAKSGSNNKITRLVFSNMESNIEAFVEARISRFSIIHFLVLSIDADKDYEEAKEYMADLNVNTIPKRMVEQHVIANK